MEELRPRLRGRGGVSTSTSAPAHPADAPSGLASGHPSFATWAHLLTDAEVDASDHIAAGRAPVARRFYLLAWGTRPDEPVAVARAGDALEACELFLLPGLRASAPFPPGGEGTPATPERVAPEARLVVTRTGGNYLVAEVDWPSGRRPTAGELWRTFTVKEVGQFHQIWRHLARR